MDSTGDGPPTVFAEAELLPVTLAELEAFLGQPSVTMHALECPSRGRLAGLAQICGVGAVLVALASVAAARIAPDGDVAGQLRRWTEAARMSLGLPVSGSFDVNCNARRRLARLALLAKRVVSSGRFEELLDQASREPMPELDGFDALDMLSQLPRATAALALCVSLVSFADAAALVRRAIDAAPHLAPCSCSARIATSAGAAPLTARKPRAVRSSRRSTPPWPAHLTAVRQSWPRWPGGSARWTMTTPAR